jgi:NTE family protein
MFKARAGTVAQMSARPFAAPDVLVLAGGGIVGEAWMQGLLAGLEDAAGVDFRETEAFVGTSAGSIVAARLTSGRRPPRPRDPDAHVPPTDEAGNGSALTAVAREAARIGWAATAPVASAAVALGAPAGGVLRAALLSRAAGHGQTLSGLHARVARWGPRFDGRLRVCVVDRRTGRRVVFGRPGAPRADVPDAVCASCAIPWVFSPVTIGGREYVDGGAWSITNLDAAPAGRGTQVLCLDPAASLGGEDRRLVAMRSAFRVASSLEIRALRRRGARVQHVAPDAAAARVMGPNLMAPNRWEPTLAAGYRQGLALGGR